MNGLQIFSRDGQLYTDSREVAEMIGKDHAHLMRDITGYIEVLNQSKIGFVDFFKKSGYKDAKGEERPCYSITKKGCEFVANKLTGKKGITFTAIYVNAFHDMENKLAGKPTKPKKFSLASFNHLLEINVRQMKAANQPATHIASWTNGMTREVLAPFGIDVPALPDAVPTTYDATEMAKKLGVYSKSGNPHPQPITAIIKKVGLAPVKPSQLKRQYIGEEKTCRTCGMPEACLIKSTNGSTPKAGQTRSSSARNTTSFTKRGANHEYFKFENLPRLHNRHRPYRRLSRL